MKKFLFVFLCLVLLTGCSDINALYNNYESRKDEKESYIRAVWLSYFELSEFTKGKNEEEFKKRIKAAFKELQTMGFNTVTVHIRPCADAFYKSAYFPSSEYCFGKQGSDMPYDPFKIICETAPAYKLKVEAWINPYRVSQQDDIKKLSDNNLAKKWFYSKDKKSNVYFCDKKIFFNPACEDVIKLVVNGVKEVVENYDIYSIHFDDYFYPTTKEDIDKAEFKKYLDKGGKMSLSDWRRENVNIMIKRVYRAIKDINNNVKFGVSPAANIENDYNSLYADVLLWANNSGYIDYICPQIYFGFKNTKQPFMFTTKKWLNMCNCDTYIGLPLYKCSKPDEYASDADKKAINEFVNNSNIISRQIIYLSKIKSSKGFYIFSYSSLKDKKCKKEVENMLKAMQNNNR